MPKVLSFGLPAMAHVRGSSAGIERVVSVREMLPGSMLPRSGVSMVYLGVTDSGGALSGIEVEQEFTRFVARVERRLSRALIAAYGPEVGREAARDALAYAWEHWERVSMMENPVGYLFRVGQSRSRSYRRRRVLFPEVDTAELPHVEPGLAKALEELSENQRVVLVLIHVEGLSERETARAMGVARVTVRRHAERGLTKLRDSLEVHVVD